MTARAAIPGEPAYSNAHYWTHDARRCGLATPAGACQWPSEPSLPWCNHHLSSFIQKMNDARYTAAHVRAFFEQQSWTPEAVENACARFEARFPTPKPADAATGLTVPAMTRRPRSVG